MTPFKIIGGIVACILMANGSVSKSPIAPVARVGSDNPDAHTTVETDPTPAVVSLPQETTKAADITAASNVVPILSDAGTSGTINVSGQGPGRAVSLPQATVAEQMLSENNRLRALASKPSQTLDERLCNAAQNQADYIASTGQLSHNVNSDPRSRAAKYGFPSGDFYSVREIIAPYAESVENAFSRWSKSSGHYAAILSDHDLCGFGMAQGPYGTMYVGVYGRESQPANHTVATRSYTQASPRPAEGRLVTVEVPVYGPFGRQRGTQTVTRWEGPPQQTTFRVQQSYSSCGPGGCGPVRGRRR